MMTIYHIALSALMIAAPVQAHDLAEMMTGTFTNGEQTYFDAEAGKDADDWYGMTIMASTPGALTMQTVDAFGTKIGPATPLTIEARGDLTAVTAMGCTRLMRAEKDGFVLDNSEGSCDGLPSILSRVEPDAVTSQLPDGRMGHMRRARDFNCWISVKREDENHAEGAWTFDSGLGLHDQGGRVRAGGGDSGAPAAIVRMRNVVWPAPSRNRPSLVMYVHSADDPDSAVSYSWADPNAVRVGLNLRWMQASCTLDGAEQE